MGGTRGLVVVRAGRGHRFSEMLSLPRSARSWDIALSFYDNTDIPASGCVEWLHRYVGGKWDGIWRFFSDYGEALSGYDYYWLVDDDIEVDCKNIDEIFDYVRRYDFHIAQPALTLDSYFSHRLTLACPGFLHRHTNLVEIMAPILSDILLKKLLPSFRDTRSGFGLDWYWQTLVPEPERQIAIIDNLAVRHGRPLRQNLRGAMQREGVFPEQEREQLAMVYGLNRLHGVASSGLTCDGQHCQNRFGMAFRMALNYWRVRRNITQRFWGVKETAILLYRQFFSPIGYKH